MKAIQIVIETDYILGAPPVVFQHQKFGFLGSNFFFVDNIKHQFAFSAPEAVNTLFRISNQGKRSIFSRNGMVSQRKEILPLKLGGILKFIKKIVLKLGSYLFIDESRRLIFKIFVDQNIEFA